MKEQACCGSKLDDGKKCGWKGPVRDSETEPSQATRDLEAHMAATTKDNGNYISMHSGSVLPTGH